MWWMGHFALALVLGAFTEKIAPVDPPTVAVTFLLLGMFLHSAAAIILVVPIVMPLVRAAGIDPVDLWNVDTEIADDMLTVVNLIRESHRYPNDLGFEEEIQEVWRLWRKRG